jgi:hypothetical protein
MSDQLHCNRFSPVTRFLGMWVDVIATMDIIIFLVPAGLQPAAKHFIKHKTISNTLLKGN